MDTRLEVIIEKFAASRGSDRSAATSSYGYADHTLSYRHALDTPQGAYLMCDATSDAFIYFAAQEGYTGLLQRYSFDVDSARNPDPTLYCRGRHDSDLFYLAGWHVIVETPEFLIDFTAKQFHTQACYPHIISRKIMNVPVFGKYTDPDDAHASQIAAAAAAGGK
jgi:hypothetical protein